MAYWIHESGNKNNSLWRFFQCDYISNIEKLPTATQKGELQPHDTVSSSICAPGSQCLCHEDGSVWLLGKDTNIWKKRSFSTSGGTGGITEDDIESIPRSSIESLFT